jgi:protein SCO1
MTQSANQPAVRRGLMTALLALGASDLSSANSGPGAGPVSTDAGNRVWGTEAQARKRLREQRTPNVPLVDQDGRSLRFYDDVMKDRRVLISVMYSVCSNTCTPSTRNLIETRRLLGDEARDLHFVSLSLTPLSDTPEALRAYKKQFDIGADWTFLTGKPEPVEKLLRAMGFLSDKDGDDLLSHSAMARLCDERFVRWSHVNTLLSPRSIARMIRFENV